MACDANDCWLVRVTLVVAFGLWPFAPKFWEVVGYLQMVLNAGSVVGTLKSYLMQKDFFWHSQVARTKSLGASACAIACALDTW